MPRQKLAVVALIALLAPTSSAAAQRSTTQHLTTTTTAAATAPGVPTKTIANAARATRAIEPPVLDGRTDDPAWINAQVIDQFLQYAPNEGARRSLPTGSSAIGATARCSTGSTIASSTRTP
jgi:lipoprotein-anchoring transpeptidase ErfK/SrfK